MSSPPRLLTLPEEFVLLSHLESGKVRDHDQMSFGCAAAELGELALRRKVLIRPRKSRKFGIDFYRPQGDIELLDTGRTGLVWADGLLADLEVSAAGPDPVTVREWVRQRRREALDLHREALTERGLLLHRPHRFPGKDRYHPHAVTRDALIDEVRACIHDPSRLDAHLLFLCDLVDASGRVRDLGIRTSWRVALNWLRRAGAVVESLPEELQDVRQVLRLLVPGRKSSGFEFED